MTTTASTPYGEIDSDNAKPSKIQERKIESCEIFFYTNLSFRTNRNARLHTYRSDR